jgi:hypothetical protein
MCIYFLRNNYQIILVYLYDFSYQIPKGKIHRSLEIRPSVHNAKVNSQVREGSPRGGECRLNSILLPK